MDVNVEFVLAPDVTFVADLRVDKPIKDHSQLEGRNEPGQHSIGSIVGLEESLARADTHIYEQGVASDEWVIVHNLNKYPSVTVVDSAGTVVLTAVSYDSENQCTIRMNGAFKGKAYLN